MDKPLKLWTRFGLTTIKQNFTKQQRKFAFRCHHCKRYINYAEQNHKSYFKDITFKDWRVEGATDENPHTYQLIRFYCVTCWRFKENKWKALLLQTTPPLP